MSHAGEENALALLEAVLEFVSRDEMQQAFGADPVATPICSYAYHIIILRASVISQSGMLCASTKKMVALRVS